MIAKTFLTVFVLMVTVSCFSQSYNFSHSVMTYSDLASDIKLSGAQGWLDFDYSLNLPFTFHFYDKDFTSVDIDNYGDVLFDNNFQYDFIAFGSILIDNDTVNSASPISYKTEGNTGNRILKIQYKNCGFAFSTLPAYINFQIWLYEGSNICEVHFGSSNIPYNSYAYAGQSGPQIGVYKSSSPKSVLCLKDSANNPTTSTIDNIDIFLKGTPPPNTVYTFTPVASAIEDLNSDIFMAVFPNPTTDKIFITAEEPIEAAEVYNLVGEKVKEQRIEGKSAVINVAELPRGVYLVRVSFDKLRMTEGGGLNTVRRVVKE